MLEMNRSGTVNRDITYIIFVASSGALVNINV